MKGVQCYELFGGIALKNHAFFIFFMRQNWVALPKRDMPVGAGQAGVTNLQCDKMI